MKVLQKSAGHIFRQIVPGIWQLTFHLPATVNCWLYENSGSLTLVDSGNPWNAAHILEAVAHLKKPLVSIIVTHAHPDHAGSAAAIAASSGAEVFVHEGDLRYLRGEDCLSSAPGNPFCRRILKFGSQFGFLNPTPVTNAVGIRDNESVGNLKVIHTPGHTPGSISLWSESAGALFVGDNVSHSFNLLSINNSIFTLNSKQLQESLQCYAKFPAQIVLPGHGPAFTGKDYADKVWGLKKRTKTPIF